MNRRLLSSGLVLATALTTAALSAGPVSADPGNGNAYGHSKKTPTETGCNDIVRSFNDGPVYDGTAGTLDWTMPLAAPACAGTLYSVRLFDATNPNLGTASAYGNGVDSFVVLHVAGLPKEPNLGLEGTTSVAGYVVDYAPDPTPLPLTSATDTNGNGIPDNNEVTDGSPISGNFY